MLTAPTPPPDLLVTFEPVSSLFLCHLGQLGGFGVILRSRSAAGFSSVMLSSVSLGVKCCASKVVVVGCVRCRCGSSIGCCGVSVCKCMCLVPGSGGKVVRGLAVALLSLLVAFIRDFFFFF